MTSERQREVRDKVRGTAGAQGKQTPGRRTEKALMWASAGGEGAGGAAGRLLCTEGTRGTEPGGDQGCGWAPVKGPCGLFLKG